MPADVRPGDASLQRLLATLGAPPVDSLGLVQFVLQLEQATGLRIAADEITQANFQDSAAVTRFVARKLANGATAPAAGAIADQAAAGGGAPAAGAATGSGSQ